MERFRKRFDIAPDAFAALGYDATMLVARAIASGGADRQAIRNYLAGLDSDHPFDGVTGPVYFSDGGDPLGMVFRVSRVSQGTLRSGARQ